MFAPLPSSLFLFSIYHENMEYHSRVTIVSTYVTGKTTKQSDVAPSSFLRSVGSWHSSSLQHTARQSTTIRTAASNALSVVGDRDIEEPIKYSYSSSSLHYLVS